MSEVRACASCGRLQAYPQPVCRGCGGGTFVVSALPFAAEVYSETVVARAPNPELQALTPYTAVLVRGHKGGLLLLRMQGAAPGIGASVMVCERDGILVAERA